MIPVSSHPPLRVAHALIGINYPASRTDLISHVHQHGGQPQVLALLEPLPDRTFDDEHDLASELRDSQ